MEKKPVSKSVLRWWGVSSIGTQLIANMDNTFFSYFLTDIALFSVALAGSIMTISSVVGLVIGFFIGAIIGMVKPMRWGRLRSYLLVGPPLMLILYTMKYSVLGNSLFSAIVIIVVTILGGVASSLAYTADFALVQEIASTPEERIKLNSNRMVGSNLGRLITSYAVPTFVAFVKGMMTEQKAYFILALIFSILYFVTFFIHFKLSDGYEYQLGTAKQDENLKLKDIIEAFATNKYLLYIVVADLSSNVGSFVIPALNVYYYKYVAAGLKNVGLATHLMGSSIMGLVGAYVAGIVGKTKVEKRWILCCAYATVAGLLIFSYLVAMKNAILFFVLQCLMQCVVGFTQPLESDLYMDVAVYHEWKTGKNCTAFIMGLLSIPVKIAGVIKSISITAILAAAGYVAGMTANEQLMKGVCKGYIQAPLWAPLCGLVIMLFLFNLDSKKMDQMQHEVNERRKARAEASIEDDLSDMD